MRILVLGAAGMLGHALVRELSKDHEVHAAIHAEIRPLDGATQSYGHADITDVAAIAAVLDTTRPACVINAAGVVKQKTDDPATHIAVNALAPHRLAELCQLRRMSFLHFSTDCVFSGARGDYTEIDNPDPVDIYGRSKLLGEVGGDKVLTLRTSMIGLELGNRRGLVEWFLSQRGRVSGYRGAIFSGLTTTELSRVVARLLNADGWPAGLLHVASDPINKYDLLRQLAERVPWLAVEIAPVDQPVIDRSLSAAVFTRLTGYITPSWQVMLDELADAIEKRQGSTQ